MSLTISKTIIILTILLLISHRAISSPLEEGFLAYKQGDVELAQEKWLALAIKGDVRAQFFLSVLFDKQSKGPQGQDNAKRWITASANNGFVPAQFNLGNNFHKGKYGPANNKMAEYWWNQAAVQGFPEAQYQLATLYYWGKRGVERNLKEAFYWFEQASKGGHKDAVDAVLLMRAGEQLSPTDAAGLANIAYDDERIVSKLSLDSDQLALVKQQKKLMANVPKQSLTAAPESEVLPKQDKSKTASISAPKEQPEEVIPEINVAVTKQPEKDWVSRQPPANYTIQLFASTSLKECEEYIRHFFQTYQLGAHSQSFTKKGRKYCAAIYGSYGSYSQAKGRLSQLPRKIRRAKPWIRKMAR